MGLMMPLKLSLACNNTIFFVHKPSHFEQVHMPLEGEVLFKRPSIQSTAEFVMPDDHHVVFDSYEGRDHFLTILNLQSKTTTTLEHRKLSSTNLYFYYFRDSQLICTVEE